MYNDTHKLLDLLVAFRAVERMVTVRGDSRLENDAEHSFSLTLLAWMLSRSFAELDQNRVIRYALVHDLVEAYAGDTYIWDPHSVATKKERETNAENRIDEEFREAFPDLPKTIRAYEARKDEESKFVWVLDKLIAPLMILHSGRGFWKEHGVTLAQLKRNKEARLAVFPGLTPLYTALTAELSAAEHDLFAPPHD